MKRLLLMALGLGAIAIVGVFALNSGIRGGMAPLSSPAEPPPAPRDRFVQVVDATARGEEGRMGEDELAPEEARPAPAAKVPAPLVQGSTRSGFGKFAGQGRIDTGGGEAALGGKGGRFDGKRGAGGSPQGIEMKLDGGPSPAKPKPAPARPAANLAAPEAPPAPDDDGVAHGLIDVPGKAVERSGRSRRRPASREVSRLAKEQRAVRKKSKSKLILLDEIAIEDELEEEEKAESDDREGDLTERFSALDHRGQSRPVQLSSLMAQGDDNAQAAEQRPASFLPRMCYFENTYLGGNAAYLERVRKLEAELPTQPHMAALLAPQPFDAPEDVGLRMTATLDRRWADKPGRVLLQVGLQGSRRYGWRRPPLDLVLVVDPGAPEAVLQAANAMLRRLGPQDRLGVIAVGETEPVAVVADRRAVRTALTRSIESLTERNHPPAALAHAMDQAGAMLRSAAGNTARVPGTQTIVLVTQRNNGVAIRQVQQRVHALTVQGVVTSVVELGAAQNGGWWSVANAGHGNLHRAADLDALAGTLEHELDSLAKVIARLLRVNVRLAPNVSAIRVLGSRVLGQEEVKQVKAREVATDRNLSKTMGVKSDRGEDDDGIQTVVPYFYGGDSHVILVELWVEGPGQVAEVSLRYKDMVGLGNAEARDAVALSAVPRPNTPRQDLVRKNALGFGFAAALRSAADDASLGNWGQVRRRLALGSRSPADQQVVTEFERLMQRGDVDNQRRAVREALILAADRRIGVSEGGR